MINPSHAVRDIFGTRHYPPWQLFATFVVSVGYPRYNPQKTRHGASSEDQYLSK